MAFASLIAPTPSVADAAFSRGGAALLLSCCSDATATGKRYSLGSVYSGCTESRNTASVTTASIGNKYTTSHAIKKCSRCGLEQCVTEFYKRKTASDGLQSQCKKCHFLHAKTPENLQKKRVSDANYIAGVRSTPEGREKIRLQKEKIRRANGARKRSEIQAAADKKRDEESKYQIHLLGLQAAHVTAYENRPWKYRDNAYKAEKTKAARQRRQRQKETLDATYVRRLMTKNSPLRHGDIPMALVEAKQIQLQITKFINQLELPNEKR